MRNWIGYVEICRVEPMKVVALVFSVWFAIAFGTMLFESLVQWFRDRKLREGGPERWYKPDPEALRLGDDND